MAPTSNCMPNSLNFLRQNVAGMPHEGLGIMNAINRGSDFLSKDPVCCYGLVIVCPYIVLYSKTKLN